jgi:hypothetical protein
MKKIWKPLGIAALLLALAAAGGCRGSTGEDSANGRSPAPSVTTAPPIADTVGPAASASALLSQEEALSIGKSHIQGAEVSWSARLLYDEPIEYNNKTTLYTVWVVEALYPAGNLERVYLDAADGRVLVHMDQEAPQVEDSAIQEGELQTPHSGNGSAAGNSQTEPGSGITREIPPLKLLVEKRDNGFSLLADPAKHSEFVAVMQSVESPGANKLVVHLIHRAAYFNEGHRFLLDAVIVNPDTGAFKIAPVADVTVDDSYTVGSIAKIYGFTDPEHLILVRPAAAGEGRTLRYDVAVLELASGALTTLIEGAIPDIDPDFLASGWMNRQGDTLYLNGYKGGQLWIADLKSRSVKAAAALFPHPWPVILIEASPDGGQFWYRGQADGNVIYDGAANPVFSIKQGAGMLNHRPVQWSPDSRYSVQEYTLDQNDENVLWREDGVTAIAAQGIRLLDRQGKEIWTREVEKNKGRHMEWIGWTGDSGGGLIHYYDLKREDGKPPLKLNSEYALVSTDHASPTPLQQTERLENMKAPEAIHGTDSGKLVFVDHEAGLYLVRGAEYNTGDGNGVLLSAPGDRQLIWLEKDYQQAMVTVYRYDPALKATATTRFKMGGSDFRLAGERTVFDSQMNYYYLN